MTASFKNSASIRYTLVLAMLLIGAPGLAQSASQQPAEPIAGLSPQAMQDFAERLSTAIVVRDTQGANDCIDWSSISDKSTAGLIPDPRQAKQFTTGFKQGILRSVNAPTSFAGAIINDLGNDGSSSYQLLRFHERDGQAYALFRLSSAGGINYHDYQLGMRNGQVVAKDIYILMSGEHFSATLRRLALPAVQQMNKSWIAKLVTSDKSILEHGDKLRQLTTLASQGRGIEALAVYEQLPQELQQSKIFLIHRYHAASAAGEEELLEAIDAFQAAFPDDPALPLISIDALIIRKQYDKALQSVDLLDAAVEGDPYLDLFRASINLEKGELEKAAFYAKKLVTHDPTTLDNHWNYIGILVEMKDHEATYAALSEVDKHIPSMEWNDLRDTEPFNDFAASAFGQRWLWEHGFLEERPNGLTELSPGSRTSTTVPSNPTTPRQQPKLLTWTDKSGRFSVEAEYAGLDKESKAVLLKKTDGKVVEVPLERLSQDSTEQARRAHAASKE